MLHLFKINSTLADLFISRIDFNKGEIDYSVREKVTGMLLEPAYKGAKFEVTESKIFFNSRDIDLKFAKLIATILSS